MKEDKGEKKEQELKEISKPSKEKKEVKPRLKAMQKKKYPIILIAEHYLIYKTDKGNGWARIDDAEKYKISEEYEI